MARASFFDRMSATGTRAILERMRKLRTRTLVPCLLVMLLVAPAILPGEDDPAQLFGRAVRLAEEYRLEEAIELLEQVLETAPDHRDVLWNLGLWYAELDRHSKAVGVWKRYKQVNPNDWRARAKLVQSYQALGREKLRDEERAGLIDWYVDPRDRARPEQDLFCREQFRLGDRRVMAFEFFSPSGENRVFLRFSVLDAEGLETDWYSLGSYDLTNEIAQATGEIGEGAEVYHLDR